MADAALFCAVHDVLQSPAALANVFDHLRPGAWVAAGGGKYAGMDGHDEPDHPGHNIAPTFDRLMASTGPGPGLGWKSSSPIFGSTTFSFGAGYVAVGRAHSRGRAQAGSPPTAWPAIARSQIGSQRSAPERNVPGR